MTGAARTGHAVGFVRRCDVCGRPIFREAAERLRGLKLMLVVLSGAASCPTCVGWATRVIRAAMEALLNGRAPGAGRRP